MDKLIHKSLSDHDIYKYLNEKCNIVLYSDLKTFNNIDDVLGKYKKCVILYQSGINYGHWTCIFKNKTPNTIFFFDSYGIILDHENKNVSKNIRDALHIYKNYLSELILKTKYKIDYNQFQFQQYKTGYNTCGRWVCWRLKHSDKSTDEFYEDFKPFKNKDCIITLLTNQIK